MSKLAKASVVFQILYFLGCIVVLICMPLYTTFYPSDFATLCFRIGAGFTFLSALNPIGIICAIVNVCCYFNAQDKRNGEKTSIGFLVWVILGPIITVALWLSVVTVFVLHSGGV